MYKASQQAWKLCLWSRVDNFQNSKENFAGNLLASARTRKAFKSDAGDWDVQCSRGFFSKKDKEESVRCIRLASTFEMRRAALTKRQLDILLRRVSGMPRHPLRLRRCRHLSVSRTESVRVEESLRD